MDEKTSTRSLRGSSQKVDQPSARGLERRFRFAPSPNGALHLGHAYSALLNQRLAHQFGAAFYLRIEDIDTTRCTPKLEAQMLTDLEWLGLAFDPPMRRQSQHFADYAEGLETLLEAGLVYPAFLSRAESRAMVEEHENNGRKWPRDPDGVPHYPGTERDWSTSQIKAKQLEQPRHAWRLNMAAAVRHIGSPTGLDWVEFDTHDDGSDHLETGDPADWGDVVLARSDTPTSYHLSVTLDDAQQGITHVVRGVDLAPSTSVHRLLQELLGLPQPVYHHHPLIMADGGRKLSKSARDTGLADLRTAGLQPSDIHRMVGLD
ncbi:MAG: tRNA glutamyl-Q(34) synthetase GluQRS [Pseudomonadota bacterium]